MSDSSNCTTRRSALLGLARLGGAVAANSMLGTLSAKAASEPLPTRATAGRLKQAACRWPFQEIQLETFCRDLMRLGFSGIDLLFPEEWPTAHEAGFAVSLAYPTKKEVLTSRGFSGFNDPKNHATLIKELEVIIPLAARAGIPNVISFFGNRSAGFDDAAAIDNCIAGMSRIAPLAVEHGVTICVELLNSKVDHAGYQGDHTAFGVAVMKGVNSPGVKLLYDIYHMQIMEGDIIRTIRDNFQWIGHFHTAGVPGRHEISDTQELNYRAIAEAIADLNYKGYVAHEFIPKNADPLQSLRQARQICSV